MIDTQQLLEFVGNHPALFVALGVILALLVWTTVQVGMAAVGPSDAIALINHEDALVLDIREPAELKDGVILNSLHIPLAQLNGSLGRLEKYKSRPIIASCRSGSRSQAACRTLKRHGFEKVYNLRGGILAWQNANLPLVKK